MLLKLCILHALVALCAADVSELSRKYLPPQQQLLLQHDSSIDNNIDSAAKVYTEKTTQPRKYAPTASQSRVDAHKRIVNNEMRDPFLPQPGVFGGGGFPGGFENNYITGGFPNFATPGAQPFPGAFYQPGFAGAPAQSFPGQNFPAPNFGAPGFGAAGFGGPGFGEQGFPIGNAGFAGGFPGGFPGGAAPFATFPGAGAAPGAGFLQPQVPGFGAIGGGFAPGGGFNANASQDPDEPRVASDTIYDANGGYVYQRPHTN